MTWNKPRNNGELVVNNQKGIAALGTALFVCIVLGVATLFILNINQNKRKVRENITVAMSAENIKNKLINTLNSKASWEMTATHNNIYPLAGTTITNHPKINIYDADTSAVVFNSTSSTAGHDSEGNACNDFNATQGNDRCPFHYEVTVKSVTNNGGQYLVVVRAELFFKARNSKYIFNAKKDQFSFDYTVGTDPTVVKEICESIGGVFNTTNNTCTKTLTQSASCGLNQTYQGQSQQLASPGDNYPVGITTVCGTTQMAQQTCPSGEYLYGYDPQTHHILCRNFSNE